MKMKALYDEVCSFIDPLLLQQQAVEIKIPTSKVTKKASIKVSTASFESGNLFEKMMTLKLVSP